ncbi:glycosyltransferase involved in cell wall biosynthesis [Catalinimonas alkaloidigena]|uniref:glycosyltransferase family 4 protein n=1 Tax=Catalinimonas alkaloidigena TaxID=1075417 RepID=UPI0024051419|nr:glycosyltransferase family 4 protein [Catalinimonas alkaloidigena]MDF9795648.1 glycosyltransferase involved in cell wall biosynthesis [Catalinimonas alkaloidigena]
MGEPQPLNQSLYFVLPHDRHLPSGGNVYNEQLMAALRRYGQDVEIMEFSHYRKAILRDQAGFYAVDSLFVEDMKPLLNHNPQRAFSFFILHHLQSLFPPADLDAEQYFETYEKEVLNFFQGFLLTSEYSKKYLLDRGIKAPLMVVEPALSSSVQPAIALNYPLKTLMVANVIERKGILAFLQALSTQVKEEDEFKLHIIGRTDMEPAYYEACLKLVETSELSNKVYFLGEMSHENTLKQYAQHHLFISAARMETFGMAIQEAKAYGLPLLLCKGGNTEQHLTKRGGMLCPNIFKLAGNFIELCRNDALMRELWQSAKAEKNTTNRYTWDQAAAHFLKLFSDFYI